MHIDHIAIWTNDLEKIKNFYLKYFECTVNDKYVNLKKQFSSYFLTFSSGARIELMKRDDINTTCDQEHYGYAHIAFNAGSREQVDQLTRTMELDGCHVESLPRVTGDGYYESVVLDPENNRIELVAG